MNIKKILLISLSVFTVSLMAQTSDAIKIHAAPSWVTQKEISIPKKIPIDDINKGVYYLCVDDQIKVGKNDVAQFYYHYAELLVNQTGLDEVSQLNMSYDPSYETFVLHSLMIHRGDKHIDKTKTAKITTLHREENLEEMLYDGHLTVNVIVDDVRVGDVIEYSYSIKGYNPVYKGIFSYERYIQWSIPVHYQSLSILWGKTSDLKVKIFNANIIVKEKDMGDFTKYSLVMQDNELTSINSETPGWFIPYGSVYFYENKQWHDIALWALSLYDNAFEAGSKIQALAEKIRKEHPDVKDQVCAALNYVQSKIRYLGIEMGSNSHLPSSAKETLDRRYGDCKDKSVLFISLLKYLGIKASPALVNSSLKQELSVLPPRVDAFNHVITKVHLEDKTYWLDPTRVFQKGKLDTIYQPNYKYALVLDENTQELESMHHNANSNTKRIKDTFFMPKEKNNTAIFESTTEYIAYSAEKQRYDIASSGINELKKQYLEFYRDYYADIETKARIQISDEDASGKLFQKEQYYIGDFWKKDDKKRQYLSYFYANAISSYFIKPKQTKRNSPYEVSHPIDIKQRINIHLATPDWSFKNDTKIVNNSYFKLKYKSEYDRSLEILRLTYEYQSKTDYILPKDINDYISEIKKADDLLGYTIYKGYDVDSKPKLKKKSNSLFDAFKKIFTSPDKS